MAVEQTVKPVIILVHGGWHTPECWDKVKTRLETTGYEVYAPQLITSCGPEPMHHSWRVDVAVVHDLVIPLFNRGRHAVIIGHSAGEIVATVSVQGQTIAERRAQGLEGGFGALVFVCAFAIGKRGDTLLDNIGGVFPPWMTSVEPGSNIPFSAEIKQGQVPFYSDLPPDEAKEWEGRLRHQSLRFMEEPVTFCANDVTIPMSYLICEGDETLPLPAQEAMVKAVPAIKVRRCTAGHSPFLSQPDLCTEMIIEAAKKVQ
ncbi:Alpha/beta hydrolase fold-1 [Hypoxylon trugodes]|uniref:Alpha/beta hydrolase fold-1 n=1 Tax=Hypoxylon trugodes TaxID=326681 RepID=UPI002190202A|nr:Alpha/beta hydrolase fold-1 [Hypoxylon trugodes]KAI1385728.1 Alpha/beta hydrolase fold-1 [Hypoxylon trugodes]